MHMYMYIHDIHIHVHTYTNIDFMEYALFDKKGSPQNTKYRFEKHIDFNIVFLTSVFECEKVDQKTIKKRI